VIVGHGPSLLGKPRGDLIDSYDFVVRQKQAKLNPFTGYKTDAIVGSWNQMRPIPQQLWIFIDSRFDYLTEENFQMARDRFNACIDADLCREWDARYRARRTPLGPIPEHIKQHPIASDERGHKHMSSGLHALLYACEFLRPRTVDLIGFDNVRTGEFTWSVTRGEDWKNYPDHRWDVERDMIPEIEKEWDVEVRFI
jgi:hypothetical protein